MDNTVWYPQNVNDGHVTMAAVSPFGGDEVLIRFRCTNCNSWINYAEYVPSPNFNYDRMADSDGFEDILVFCPECDEEHQGEITNGQGGMLIQIADIPLEEIYYRMVDNKPFETFKINLENITRLSNVIIDIRTNIKEIFEQEDNDLWEKERLLYNICFANCITVLESFLSDELNGFIKRYNKHISNLENSYNWIAKDKMNISQKGIDKITFHNVKNIQKFFSNFLGISMPLNTSTVSNLVSIRHDLIHRNGKKVDGTPISISHQQLIEAIKEIKIFGTKIHVELNQRFGT